eukprot:746377-Hanusia_phi.AAC.2
MSNSSTTYGRRKVDMSSRMMYTSAKVAIFPNTDVIVFDVMRENGTDGDVVVHYDLVDSAGEVLNNGTLLWLEGESRVQSVEFSASSCSWPGDRNLSLRLSEPGRDDRENLRAVQAFLLTPYSTRPPSLLGCEFTLLDNDKSVGVYLLDSPECVSASSDFYFRATRTGTSSAAVVSNFSLSSLDGAIDSRWSFPWSSYDNKLYLAPLESSLFDHEQQKYQMAAGVTSVSSQAGNSLQHDMYVWSYIESCSYTSMFWALSLRISSSSKLFDRNGMVTFNVWPSIKIPSQFFMVANCYLESTSFPQPFRMNISTVVWETNSNAVQNFSISISSLPGQLSLVDFAFVVEASLLPTTSQCDPSCLSSRYFLSESSAIHVLPTTTFGLIGFSPQSQHVVVSESQGFVLLQVQRQFSHRDNMAVAWSTIPGSAVGDVNFAKTWGMSTWSDPAQDVIEIKILVFDWTIEYNSARDFYVKLQYVSQGDLVDPTASIAHIVILSNSHLPEFISRSAAFSSHTAGELNEVSLSFRPNILIEGGQTITISGLKGFQDDDATPRLIAGDVHLFDLARTSWSRSAGLLTLQVRDGQSLPLDVQTNVRVEMRNGEEDRCVSLVIRAAAMDAELISADPLCWTRETLVQLELSSRDCLLPLCSFTNAVEEHVRYNFILLNNVTLGAKMNLSSYLTLMDGSASAQACLTYKNRKSRITVSQSNIFSVVLTNRFDFEMREGEPFSLVVNSNKYQSESCRGADGYNKYLTCNIVEDDCNDVNMTGKSVQSAYLNWETSIADAANVFHFQFQLSFLPWSSSSALRLSLLGLFGFQSARQDVFCDVEEEDQVVFVSAFPTSSSFSNVANFDKNSGTLYFFFRPRPEQLSKNLTTVKLKIGLKNPNASYVGSVLPISLSIDTLADESLFAGVVRTFSLSERPIINSVDLAIYDGMFRFAISKNFDLHPGEKIVIRLSKLQRNNATNNTFITSQGMRASWSYDQHDMTITSNVASCKKDTLMLYINISDHDFTLPHLVCREFRGFIVWVERKTDSTPPHRVNIVSSDLHRAQGCQDLLQAVAYLSSCNLERTSRMFVAITSNSQILDPSVQMFAISNFLDLNMMNNYGMNLTVDNVQDVSALSFAFSPFNSTSVVFNFSVRRNLVDLNDSVPLPFDLVAFIDDRDHLAFLSSSFSLRCAAPQEGAWTFTSFAQHEIFVVSSSSSLSSPSPSSPSSCSVILTLRPQTTLLHPVSLTISGLAGFSSSAGGSLPISYGAPWLPAQLQRSFLAAFDSQGKTVTLLLEEGMTAEVATRLYFNGSCWKENEWSPKVEGGVMVGGGATTAITIPITALTTPDGLALYNASCYLQQPRFVKLDVSSSSRVRRHVNTLTVGFQLNVRLPAGSTMKMEGVNGFASADELNVSSANFSLVSFANGTLVLQTGDGVNSDETVELTIKGSNGELLFSAITFTVLHPLTLANYSDQQENCLQVCWSSSDFLVPPTQTDVVYSDLSYVSCSTTASDLNIGSDPHLVSCPLDCKEANWSQSDRRICAGSGDIFFADNLESCKNLCEETRFHSCYAFSYFEHSCLIFRDLCKVEKTSQSALTLFSEFDMIADSQILVVSNSNCQSSACTGINIFKVSQTSDGSDVKLDLLDQFVSSSVQSANLLNNGSLQLIAFVSGGKLQILEFDNDLMDVFVIQELSLQSQLVDIFAISENNWMLVTVENQTVLSFYPILYREFGNVQQKIDMNVEIEEIYFSRTDGLPSVIVLSNSWTLLQSFTYSLQSSTFQYQSSHNLTQQSNVIVFELNQDKFVFARSRESNTTAILSTSANGFDLLQTLSFLVHDIVSLDPPDHPQLNWFAAVALGAGGSAIVQHSGREFVMQQTLSNASAYELDVLFLSQKRLVLSAGGDEGVSIFVLDYSFGETTSIQVSLVKPNEIPATRTLSFLLHSFRLRAPVARVSQDVIYGTRTNGVNPGVANFDSLVSVPLPLLRFHHMASPPTPVLHDGTFASSLLLLIPLPPSPVSTSRAPPPPSQLVLQDLSTRAPS